MDSRLRGNDRVSFVFFAGCLGMHVYTFRKFDESKVGVSRQHGNPGGNRVK
jgi:hypothetical protein